MSLSNHVTVTISADSVGVSRAGFGTPLLISYSAGWAERVRTYTTLAGVAADFAVTTSPEYLAASALFSQSPRPERIKIARGALPPTLTYTITPTAVHSHEYAIQVEGEGVTSTEASYTSDATATVAEITAGLETALNAVAGKNFTATDNATDVSVAATAAGDWFSLEALDITNLKIEIDNADPGIATDLAAINTEDSDWYFLLTNYNSNAMVLATATWVESNKKLYVVDVPDNDAINTTVGNSDTLDDLATAARVRTAGIYHPSPAEMIAACWVGRMAPLQPGSATWKFKVLSGPSSISLTSTQRTNAIARDANFYEPVATITIMSEGTTSDGGFIDNRRSIDWLDNAVQTEVFNALAASNKVPYTDPGVAVVTGAIRGILQEAVQKGVLAATPEPTVTAPEVADVSSANKDARILPDVNFSGSLAGAIHSVTITGVVSV